MTLRVSDSQQEMFVGISVSDDPPTSGTAIDILAGRYCVSVGSLGDSERVVHKRLIDMWETCTNYHYWFPIKFAARRCGLELEAHEFGKRCREV